MENNYTQLCVWPGITLEGSSTKEFENFMKDELNARVKFHTTVNTLPDIDENGNSVPNTGGRSDLFFYVHNEDVENFAVPRLKMGIRWWEDVIGYNDNSHLYTKEFIAANPLTW